MDNDYECICCGATIDYDGLCDWCGMSGECFECSR